MDACFLDSQMESQYSGTLKHIAFEQTRSRTLQVLATGIKTAISFALQVPTIPFNYFACAYSFVGVFLAHVNNKLQCLEQLEDPYWGDLIYYSQNAAIRTLQSHDAVAV